MQISAVAQHASEEAHELAALLQRLWREISLRDVRSGRWFTKLLTSYVAFHEAQPSTAAGRVLSATEREAAVTALIAKSARTAALAGAASAAGVTGASIAAAESAWIAAPLVLPIAAAGMVGEMVLRSLVHIGMACDIAALYGIRFPPGREHELVRAYALAFGAEMHETEHDPGRGLVERVIRLQDSDGLGKLVANRMVGETLLRNVLPFADVVISAIQNWRLTQQVGRFVQGYARRRLELDAAIDALAQRHPESLELGLEGVWFIFISDGRLTGVEAALLAHLLRRQHSQALTPRLVSDEAGWLERVHTLAVGDDEMRHAFLHVLEAATSVDATLSEPERAVLRHAAEALGLKSS
jgi:hypothetical protein